MIETAAQHLVVRIPTAAAAETVAEVLARVRRNPFDAIDAVYVVDAAGRLEGVARLADLLSASDGARLSSVALRAFPRATLGQDQETVAAEAIRHQALSVPVVDADGRLRGAVPAVAVMEILRREHVEDLHRLAGIQRESFEARSALEEPPARGARHRLPWLLVGLAGSMLAAALVSRFEGVLETSLAVAFFVPAIVYLADAIGTQTEAIAVRGLSLSVLSPQRLLRNELGTGMLIGLVLGVVAFPVVAAVFRDWRLALTVASSIVVAGAVATTIGLSLPWALQRLGSDPAFGSGPLATIIQDLLSLLIYFAIAAWIMH